MRWEGTTRASQTDAGRVRPEGNHKRHVLAHQELQHTLTEQAVLKRMAAEGTDPFVVRLWWSFHDKENLFLVIVSRPFIYCMRE